MKVPASFVVIFNLFILVAGAIFTKHLTTETPKTVGEILDFLEEVSDNFVLGDSKDIVLVLGNTGSGKSALTLLITDAELEGQNAHDEDDDEEADYIVVDKNSLISNETTTVSKTLIPNHLIDSSYTSFYDCAGFDDSRGVAHDIAVTYLIRKLLNYANNVKFLFTIPEWSVKVGGERLEFKKLLKHATNLIVDIEKYKDSMALAVTKAAKPPNRNQAKDEPKIKKVATFLEQVKTDLDESENAHIREQKLKFIDALLKKGSDGNYARIRMHRMVNEKGPLKNMPVQEQEKKAIKNMVYQAIQYQEAESADFGYAISSDSALKVVDLLDELQQQLLSDVSDIGNEIKKLYWQQEKQNTDINVIYEKIQEVNQKLSNSGAKDSNDLDGFRDSLQQMVNSHNMKELLKTQLKRLDRHLEFVNFLTSVGNKNLSSSFKISDGLLDTKRYFSDSEKYYGFLKNAHKEISAYSQQDKIKKYIKFALINKVNQAIDVLGETAEMQFQKTGIQSFLNDFDVRTENVNVNSFKLKAFVTLLNQLTMPDEVLCSSRKLTVKGYNVKMGDYFANLTTVCNTKSVEIFALNKVFFDMTIEKRDEQVQIVVVAPTWEVTGSDIKLDLSGSSGKDYDTAAKSGHEGQDGEAGKPGRPGGQSGHFFGIADRFVNDKNLKIFTNGGRGGNGQNAGKGGDGKNGATPPYTSGDFNCDEIWDKENFKYKTKRSASIGVATFTYQVNGKEGKKPSNGGDGGCGGLGGKEGNLRIIGLNQSPKISASNSTGLDGVEGKGAPGGETSSDGDSIEVENSFRINAYDRGGMPYFIKLRSVMTQSSRGKRYTSTSGKDGASCQFRENPVKQIAERKPTEAINLFKSFMRENLKNNIRENELREFLRGLETDQKVEPLYDVVSFVDDLQNLQEQYFKMRKTLDFRPFFESMLARIVEKDKTIASTDELKKALNYLYAATLSKITSNAAGQQTILNLNAYLEEIEKQLKDLEVTERDVQIASYRNQYNSSLYSKIDAADELIKNKILPEIDVTLDNTKLKITKLIDETIDKQNQTEEAIKKEKEKERELGRSMFMSSIFSMLKITSSALAFMGPVGAGIGGVLGAGTLIGEAVTGKTSELKGTVLRLTWSVNKIGEEIKYSNDLFKQQLDDVARELDSNQKYKDDFKIVRNEVDNMKQKIKEAMTTENDVQVLLAKEMRTKLDELVQKEQDMVKKLKPQGDKILSDKLRILSHIQTTISIVGLSVDVYNQFKTDQTKMEAIKNSIQSLEVELQGWKVYEQQIYNIMVPMFQLMQNSMKSTIQSLEGQSHVQLDIRKWEVRNKLRDVKFTFSQMTETSKLQKDFAHQFEKVEAAMDILIDVYDRIESLVENSQFATYVSQIAQNGPPLVQDFELEGAIKRLDAIIQTNIILDRHELVVNAFKQHYFPFAPLYFDKFELPSSLQLNDTDSLKRRAIAQIKDLKTGVIFSQITIENRDKYLYSDVNFDSEGSKDAPPFYTWKSAEVFNQTKKLLQGGEIFLNVDITKATINDYAVKFHGFILRLKLSNKNLQRDFDDAIKDYHVTLKMIGNSFFRCSQRIYSIPTDSNLVLDYSLKYGQDGRPTNPNDVYKKIRGNSNFLSPYGLWSVQLTKSERSAQSLTKFEDELIDVEFAGKGEYLQNVPAVTSETCTDDLDKYYFLDSIYNFRNSFYSPILMKRKVVVF